jgi:hypothetical protein
MKINDLRGRPWEKRVDRRAAGPGRPRAKRFKKMGGKYLQLSETIWEINDLRGLVRPASAHLACFLALAITWTGDMPGGWSAAAPKSFASPGTWTGKWPMPDANKAA